MTRIVRLANFVTPNSGGLRTALAQLGQGYRRAGHDPYLIVPGARAADEDTAQGRVITLPGPVLPGSGGYRVLAGRSTVRALLQRLAPDRLEVCDRFSLRWTGDWARRFGIPAVMVSHESLQGLLTVAGLPVPAAALLADRLNARTAAAYDTVVCTTGWAAAEFRRLGVAVRQVPLGVDLTAFHPSHHDPGLRRMYASDRQVLLVHCGRLSVEKRPGRSIEAIARLRQCGVDAVLVVAGDGPLRGRLVRRAAGLPVHFTRFLPDRREVARLLATADVALAPGPIETFGLAALEALACGTPVVVDAASALPEVVADAGVAVHADFATGVLDLLARPVHARRDAARIRAEAFDWPSAVGGFLAAHRIAATQQVLA